MKSLSPQEIQVSKNSTPVFYRHCYLIEDSVNGWCFA